MRVRLIASFILYLFHVVFSDIVARLTEPMLLDDPNIPTICYRNNTNYLIALAKSLKIKEALSFSKPVSFSVLI